METLALLAEGNRSSSLTRAKGYKEDTILEWLREAAGHAEQVEAVLMRDFKVKRGQLDALWAYIGRKKASPEDEAGEVWQSTLCGQREVLEPMKPRPASKSSRP